ncbi:MAG TPA: 50S ribosomal protein L25, partial [Planctomycetaceae bacterium]|nr:50S ribosomal protein L25 [Planctomycetaceae bacterium]
PAGRATVEVVVELRGEPVGVKDGGVLKQNLKRVTLDCPDYRIPKSIQVKVGAMKVGDVVRASDLQLPDHAVLVTAADAVVAELYDPRKAV